jgi:hypothetical protein
MTTREDEEYRALRATIRERGTMRVWIFAAGIVAWAALALATAALASTPLATLLPLLALAAVFEAIFALHVGVERIGRYVAVFHERADETARWEHVAMAFGRPAGAATADALFVVPFLIAGVFNVTPALLLQPIPAELAFVGGAHTLFLLRVLVAKHSAAKQRAIDQARFTQLWDAKLT